MEGIMFQFAAIAVPILVAVIAAVIYAEQRKQY